MKERTMTTIEKLRLITMQETLAGTITNLIASKKLNLSIRQIQRLKKRFKEQGLNGLIHSARGKSGLRRININLENNIVRIIKENYHDFGPLMVWEKIKSIHQINVGKETIRQIMIRNNIWKSKRRKRTRYFSWRERRSNYGELIQFDGSYYNWFESRNKNIPEACLLASIDDATGKITHAVFDYNEGVEAVFSCWWEYIKVNGIPVSIYLDKFSTYKINHKEATDNKNLMTQFGRVVKELGIELIYAHSPQAKGRIERLFQTLQDRLVKEMRLSNINTIEEANVFLKTIFIPWYNKKYSVMPKSDINCHRKLDPSTTQRLISIFAKHYTRSINNDFTIRYNTKYYQLKSMQPTTVFKKDRVLIEERLNKTIKIRYKKHYLKFFELPEKPRKINSSPTILTAHIPNWKPPVNHPWRQYVTG